MKLVLYVFTLLSLTGCFKYSEKLYLNKDKSGTLEINIEFGKMISMLTSLDEDDGLNIDELEGDIRTPKGVRLLSVDEFEKRGRRHWVVMFEFDNVNDLQKLELRGNNHDVHFEDFFESISYDGENYSRRIELGNGHRNRDDNDQVPAFIQNLIDISFKFNVEFEDGTTEYWTFDLQDLSNKDDLIMTLKN